MTQVNFRLPEDVHRALKILSAMEGITVTDAITRLLYTDPPFMQALELARRQTKD